MVRKAKIEDVKSILNLIKFGTKQAKVLSRSREEIETNIKNFFIDVENKEIVGCISLEIYSPKLGEIRSLVVKQKFQQRGIGSKLVKYCVQQGKKKGVMEILAITDKDQFFGKLGFRKTLENQWPMFLRIKKFLK